MLSRCPNLKYLKLPYCHDRHDCNSEEAIKCLIQNGKMFKTMILCEYTEYSKKFLLELKKHVVELFGRDEDSTKITRITESSLAKIPNSRFKTVLKPVQE